MRAIRLAQPGLLFAFLFTIVLVGSMLPVHASTMVFHAANPTIEAGDTRYDGQDLVVSGCKVTIHGTHHFNSLRITNGGIVTAEGQHRLSDTYNNLDIDANSTLSVSGQGYDPGSGPGGGGSEYVAAGGGAHGGNGGQSPRQSRKLGGIAYDDPLAPTDSGSGGGTDGYVGQAGGKGGGAVRLIVTGTLTLDGVIQADGADGGDNEGSNYVGHSSGGGAGGSIYLTVGTFVGKGRVEANGGKAVPGWSGGGGGGGGRIAIEYTTKTFTGSMSALGGQGWQYGGAGTIYTVQSGHSGMLLIDNAGNAGEATPLATPVTADVTVSNAVDFRQQADITATNLQLIASTWTCNVGQSAFAINVLGNMTLTGGHMITQNGRVNITVQCNAALDTASDINLIGAGYPAATGPGAGQSNYVAAGGGAHGGNGGESARVANLHGTATNDSLTAPTDLGSGGGIDTYGGSTDNAGGGAVRLIVNGTLAVNGKILATGAHAPDLGGNNAGHSSGGGAGGSIYLTVGTLAGSGTVNADGGISDYGWSGGGGGGGGRIAVEYTTKTFTGSISAIGGTGWANGGAGTVYTVQYGKAPVLLVDNGGNAGAFTPLTQLNLNSSVVALYDVTVSNGADALQQSDVGVNTANVHTLHLNNGIWTQNNTHYGIYLNVSSDLTAINGSHFSSPNGLLVNVGGNATFTKSGAELTGPSANGHVFFSVAGSVALDANSDINVTGAGYAAATGPGAGGSNYVAGGGGAHAGNGGNALRVSGLAGTATNENLFAPTGLGSGGGIDSYGGAGGAGGGSVQLSVNGTLTLDGQILADGANGQDQGGNGSGYSNGGGAGGSIYVTTGTFAGGGTLGADGGQATPGGSQGGGGGGGCIAVAYTTKTFTGTHTALGGHGYQNGGAGTVYYKPASGTPLLIVVNCGTPSSGQPLNAATPLTTAVSADVTLANGANLLQQAAVTANNLLLSDSYWTCNAAQSSEVALSVQGNMTVTNSHILSQDGRVTIPVHGSASLDSTSDINVTGGGYLGSTGPGAGGSEGTFGGGGAHGGNGGTGTTWTPSSGGTAYDNPLAPTDFGSGAGYVAYENHAGAAGGGAVRLNVQGNLTLNGQLLAQGANPTGDGSGGAGGSIYLTAATFAGSGTIAANGGNVNRGDLADGGGGGRIAVEYTTKTFTGTLSAIGGNGHYGGAGTIYLKPASGTPFMEVVNSGTQGAFTPLSLPVVCDLTVANGSNLLPLTVMTLHNLQLNGSYWTCNAALSGTTLTVTGDMTATGSHVVSPNGSVNFAVQGKATLDAASDINVTGAGYAGANGAGTGGPGAGGSEGTFGGGGAHGGNGGTGSTWTPSVGGTAYDNPLAPTDFGSGAGYVNYEGHAGAAGGGAVRLTVNGALILNGQLLAHGANPTGDGSGGAGGSLYLTVGTLAGSGTIAANGGNVNRGDLADGGGGGRIAVEYTTKTFTGTVSAFGGNGHYGGAGTIYLKPAGGPGTLTVNNNGNVGAMTPILAPLPTLAQLNLANNAWVLPGPGNTGLTQTVTGNATFDATSGIDVSGVGFAGDAGPGAGQDGNPGGSGAGYGGAGGNAASGAVGGTAYGSKYYPVDPGSGGGTDTSDGTGPGGTGGGTLALNVGGTLQVDGQLSASGLTGMHGGGGAGGSVLLLTPKLAGAGWLYAKGGDAANRNQSGGGGGGRIAVYTANLTGFNQANIDVDPGLGYQGGAAGTIYLGQQVALPDLWIKSSTDNAYTGVNVFSLDGANQTARQSVFSSSATTYTTFNLTINNAGFTADSFVLTAAGSATGWTLRAFDIASGSAVISALTGVGWTVGPLAPGASAACNLYAFPSSSTSLGVPMTVTITAVSKKDGTKKDVVKAVSTALGAQPDLLIRASTDSAYLGQGIVNLDGTSQTRSQNVASGKTAGYNIKVLNSGTSPDTFVLNAAGSATGWSLFASDLATGAAMTSAFTGAGWIVGPLAPGASATCYLGVTPGSAVTPGSSLPVMVTVVSRTDGTKKDVVKALTTELSYQPDLLIGAGANGPFLGQAIFNLDGTTQTLSQWANAGSTATCYITLRNAGNTADSYTVRGSDSGGFTLQYFDSSTGANVTASATSGQLTVALLSGQSKNYRVVTLGTVQGATDVVTLVATSKTDGTKQDVVKDMVTVNKYQPDVLIGVSAITAIGQNIFNTTGAGQTLAQRMNAHASAVCFVMVQNAGNTADRYLLQQSDSMAGSGFAVQFYDNDTGTNVSASATAGQLSVTLLTGATKVYRVMVTGATPVTTDTLQVTATSIADHTRQDVVKDTLTVNPTFIITPSAGPYGAISPNTAQTVNYGGNITFSAVANTGYTADTWSLDGAASQTGGAQYALNSVTAAHTVNVTFKQLTFTVTPTADPNGTITPNTAQTVIYGSSITFLAVANTSYTADTWSLDGTSVQNGGAQYALNSVTASHTVKVTFKKLTFTITPSAGTNGVIGPNTAQTIIYGNNVTFIAMPNTNYIPDTWTLDGAIYQTGSAVCTLNNVTANHTIKVTFKPIVRQPDLLIRLVDETAYTGGSIFNLDGTNQTKSLSVPDGVPACYLFRIQNAGNSTDTFTIKAPAGASGWALVYFDMTSGATITGNLTGTGWSTGPLAPGAKLGFFAQVTSGYNVAVNTQNNMLVTATSVEDSTKKDAVKAVTIAGGDVAKPRPPNQ